MIKLLELIENEKQKGYSEANAGAKVCQDLLLKAISNSICVVKLIISVEQHKI